MSPVDLEKKVNSDKVNETVKYEEENKEPLDWREWLPLYGVYAVLSGKTPENKRSVLDGASFYSIGNAAYHGTTLMSSITLINYLLEKL